MDKGKEEKKRDRISLQILDEIRELYAQKRNLNLKENNDLFQVVTMAAMLTELENINRNLGVIALLLEEKL